MSQRGDAKIDMRRHVILSLKRFLGVFNVQSVTDRSDRAITRLHSLAPIMCTFTRVDNIYMFALWAHTFQFSWDSDKREVDTDHECFQNDSLIC